MMEAVKVESSALSAIAYDAASETFEAHFKPNKSGDVAVWSYSPVPAWVFEEMTQPDVSVGKVFHERIKLNASLAGRRIATIHADGSIEEHELDG